MENRLKLLPDGRYLAVDSHGTSHICQGVERAMRYLWNENEGKDPADQKYKKDVSPLPKKSGLLPQFDLDPDLFDFLCLLEEGGGSDIDEFLSLRPDFAEKYFQSIPDFIPDPNSSDFINTLADDGKVSKKATWEEVKEKGLSLLMDFEAVHVNYKNTNRIVAKVEGYHGNYNTMLLRKAHLTKDNEPSEGYWFCTCEWGQWCNSGHRPHDGPDSTGSVKIQNRFCSHAYACYLLLHDKYLYDAYVTPDNSAVLF